MAKIGRPKMTKCEKLLRIMQKKKNGMTVMEMRTFLAGGKKNLKKLKSPTSYANSTLFPTRDCDGLLWRFCSDQGTGRYRVVEKIKPPFLPKNGHTVNFV